MKNEKGQTILILLLILTIALGIGLSIVEKSFTDVSTASKVEQSLRAFSAAEAGIEKAIKGSGSSLEFTDNSSSAISSDSGPLPAPGQPLESQPPGLSKKDIEQVWLVSPIDLTSSQYSGNSLDIYWGNEGVSVSDTPALEVSLIYKSTDPANLYKAKKYFFDKNAVSRTNGFTVPTECPSGTISTYFSANKRFQCKKTIDISTTGIPDIAIPGPVMLRARILYSEKPQAFAVAPVLGSNIPAQERVYVSTGVSGDTKRRVQLSKRDKIVPFYFDYAIFSAGDITK